MVHLLERHHNDRFRECMDRFMPQWRLHRKELNRAPLSYARISPTERARSPIAKGASLPMTSRSAPTQARPARSAGS